MTSPISQDDRMMVDDSPQLQRAAKRSRVDDAATQGPPEKRSRRAAARVARAAIAEQLNARQMAPQVVAVPPPGEPPRQPTPPPVVEASSSSAAEPEPMTIAQLLAGPDLSDDDGDEFELSPEEKENIATGLLTALLGGADEVADLSGQPTTADLIARSREAFAQGNYGVHRRAVMNDGIYGAAVDPAADGQLKSLFSHETEPRVKKITDQYWSGRCWIFAGCNVLRGKMMEKYNLKDFRFSKTYLYFWDKFEKANTFLCRMISMRDQGLDESTWMRHLLHHPQQDGGWWSYFANVVEKYGIVPECAMGETMNSVDSYELNTLLDNTLRQFARDIRALAEKDGVTEEDLHKFREERMQDIYRILAINFGEPPTSFDWQYQDRDKKVHRVQGLDPQTFYKECVGVNLKDYAVLVYAPTMEGERLGSRLVMRGETNVIDGEDAEWWCVSMKDVWSAAFQAIRHNEPVWFACDVGAYADFWKGYLDRSRVHFDEVYGIKEDMSRVEQIAYHVSEANHAMVLTGCDWDATAKKPRKWKVLNSWGKDFGDKGHWVMTQDWFENHVADVVIPKHLLPKGILKIGEHKPTYIKPWDTVAGTRLS